MRIIVSLLFFSTLLYSCAKVPVDVTDNGSTTDPNISYIDNYTIDLATYKIDSFKTSGNVAFTVGYHKDPLFGMVKAASYAQINLPSDNPVKDKTVSFDSLVIIIKPNGEYYGDTLRPYKVEINRLVNKIENDDGATNFYNPRIFSYDPAILGSLTKVIRPKKDTAVIIRLSDMLGQELLQKLKSNNSDIQDNTHFVNYFNGIVLSTDTTVTKTVYYFGQKNATGIMRLHYHLLGAFSEEKYLDFPISSNNQYNNLAFTHSGTDLSVFSPFKTQLKKSSLTGHKVYVNSNMATYAKISFPTILKLKEMHPFVKVMKAELIIKPSPDTYRYPYSLPSGLNLYVTDENNVFKRMLALNLGQNTVPLNGNLYIDYLYGDKTNYTYDITEFINEIIDEGKFSKSALMLVPTVQNNDTQIQRLVINDQTLTKGIQLKLYVLGL
jgi:hypothetical protein